MPQPLEYHDFADERAWLGIPNFQNVVSNLPFLVAGAWGLTLVPPDPGKFKSTGEGVPYLVFFLGAVATFFCSSFYHLAPDNGRLAVDRFPMTLGFAGLIAAVLGERVSPRLAMPALAVLVSMGGLSVMWWLRTEQLGAGNVILYGVFQGWSILLIVLVLILYPSHRYSHGHLLIWAAVWYGLAKLFETFDDQVYALTGELVSGHAIKHVLAALSVFAIVWQLRLRRPVQAASIPAA